MQLFEPFRPMEPKLDESQRIFTNPNYIYQVKWDGVRGIVHSSPGKVKIFNKKMRDKTLQYPELQVLGNLDYDLILDGELVVLRSGVPNFSEIIRRDFASERMKIKTLASSLPITYCIFDIIYWNGQKLNNISWGQRQKFLLKVKEDLASFKNMHFTESFEKGRELFEVVKANELEGIVAKDINSFYEIGQKTGKWVKIKYRRQKHCAVCGYTLKNLRPSALLLGLYNENGELVYVGRAGSGLTGEIFNQLVLLSKDMIVEKPPVVNPPRENLKYVWLEPRLSVLVEYAEWTEEMSLRSPVVKGFTKISPKECFL